MTKDASSADAGPGCPVPAAPRRAPCACAPGKRQSAAPPSSRDATRQPPPLPVFLKPMQRRRTLWTLYAVNFLNATGMWFFLPLLPIFLGRKGGSAALVGVVFAAGLLANATPPDQRGRAFGYMQATNMGGMLIGPAVGGFIALLNLGVVFTIAAALSAITVLAL